MFFFDELDVWGWWEMWSIITISFGGGLSFYIIYSSQPYHKFTFCELFCSCDIFFMALKRHRHRNLIGLAWSLQVKELQMVEVWWHGGGSKHPKWPWTASRKEEFVHCCWELLKGFLVVFRLLSNFVAGARVWKENDNINFWLSFCLKQTSIEFSPSEFWAST